MTGIYQEVDLRKGFISWGISGRIVESYHQQSSPGDSSIFPSKVNRKHILGSKDFRMNSGDIK
jgi:hypothetical protein